MAAISREVGGSQSISQTVMSIVMGTLLGDGYVYPNGTLQIDHAVRQQAYVEWKYAHLQSVVGKPPRIVERIHPSSGRRSTSVRFLHPSTLHQGKASLLLLWREAGAFRCRRVAGSTGAGGLVYGRRRTWWSNPARNGMERSSLPIRG